jgi:hypothetical protein
MKADYLTPARGFIRYWAKGNINIEPIQGCYIYEYGQMRNPNLFMMIPECCIWYDPRMWDDTPMDVPLGDSLRYAHKRMNETNKYLLNLWNRALPYMKSVTPIRSMMEEDMAPLLKDYTNVSNPPFKFDEKVYSRTATLAEKIGVEGREDLYVMFPLGGLIRSFDEELSKGGSGKLGDLREEAYNQLLVYDRHLHETYRVTAHPIRNLVGVGIGSILHSAEYARVLQR